jgi:hypothetical protein
MKQKAFRPVSFPDDIVTDLVVNKLG